MPPDAKRAPSPMVEEEEGAGAPLIPETVIDAALQRFFLVSLFTLIQAWKAYYLIVLRTSGTSSPNVDVLFVALFAVVDGAFLWLLPLFNLPYLTFSPLNTLLLMLVLNALTLMFSSAQTLTAIVAVFAPIYKAVFQSRQLTITGDSIKDSALANVDSHFKGKLTIHYLPDALALFNPFDYSGCLSDKSPPLIPIEFNTTAPLGSLQLRHISPSNKISYIDYPQKIIDRIQKRDHSHLHKQSGHSDPRISYVEVPVTLPGEYSISLVKDHKGVEIRTSRSTLRISACPRAKFTPDSIAGGNSKHVCLKNGVLPPKVPAPSLFAYGVPPLTVVYSVTNNGQHLADVSVPLGSVQSNVTAIELLQPQQLDNVALSESLVQESQKWRNLADGVLGFHLVQITDSVGHSQRYNPQSHDPSVFSAVDLKRTFSVALGVVDPHIPLLIDGQKQLKVECDAKADAYPVTVEILHADMQNKTSSITKVLKSPGDLTFPVSLQGRYSIQSATDRLCACDVVEPRRSVELDLAPLPTANISAESINDKCLGTIGYNFNLSCSGMAPFLVSYTVFKKERGKLVPVPNEHGHTKRMVRITDTRHAFKFSPLTGGDYAVVFDSVRDALYKDTPIPLDKEVHTYETLFTQVSLVSFFKSQNDAQHIRVCPGVPISIPLYFDGNGPFTFEYEFVDATSGKLLGRRVAVSNVSLYVIEAPSKVLGKTFKVILHNVVDKFACAATIDPRGSVTVESRSVTPVVGIERSDSVIVAEGDVVEVPLRYSGTEAGQARLEYKYQSLDDPNETQELALTNSRQLRVQKAGRYSLLSFSDGGCPGQITNQDRVFTVKHYPRPTLRVSSDVSTNYDTDSRVLSLLSVCLNHQIPLRLSLQGAAPFVIDYEIESPGGIKEMHSLNVKLDSVEVKLPANLAGVHTHRFINVFDAHYTKQKSPGRKPMQSVRYIVHGMPDIDIEESDQVAQVCETQVKSHNTLNVQIPVKLQGAFPFMIEATLTSDRTGTSEKVLFENVLSPTLALSRDGVLELGEHILTFDRIVDGNGCEQTDFSPSLNFVVVVTEAPSIHRNDAHQDLCVGDHVSYSLTGAPPFQIFYDFNGQPRRATLDHTFERLASVPGKLYITGIEDSSHQKCAVDYLSPLHAQDYRDLHVTVHDLPSVEINHGKYIVRDIHQGEQTSLVFTFKGVPPFSLTYVRTLETPRTKKSKAKLVEVERHTISDIWEYQHSVPADLEGTYEAIEVSDAFCRAIKKQ